MPGTAPQGWQNPKTSYTADDVLTPQQFERIEGNAYATELGARTIDPSQSPTGVIGTLRQLLDWFANRIRAILGTTNWYDAPPTTLTAAKSHIDAAAPHSGHATTTALTAHTSAAAPHSGHATTTALTAHTSAAAPHSDHETPSGAQAKVDAHASQSAPHSGHATTTALNNHTSATNAHSATSAATANRIMMRDSAGRAKVAAPSAADDIARKDTVDAKFHASTGHKHTGAAGDGPKIPATSIEGGVVTTERITGLVWAPESAVTLGFPFTARSMAVAPSLQRVVVVGRRSSLIAKTVYTSDDKGKTWSERDYTIGLNRVTWSPTQNLFVAVGENGKILTSSDGITWIERTSGVTTTLNDVIWFQDKFVVVGSQVTCLTSSNGTSWTKRTLPSGLTGTVGGGLGQGLVQNGTYAFAIARSTDGYNHILRSSNGTTWSSVYSVNSDSALYGLGAVGSTLYLGLRYGTSANQAELRKSVDHGQTWVTIMTGSSSPGDSFRYCSSGSNGIVITASSGLFYSRNGDAWLNVANAVGPVEWLEDRWLAVSNNMAVISPP